MIITAAAAIAAVIAITHTAVIITGALFDPDGSFSGSIFVSVSASVFCGVCLVVSSPYMNLYSASDFSASSRAKPYSDSIAASVTSSCD